MNEGSLPIAFQGEAGANSDLAIRTVFPGRTSLPCLTFDEAFAAVRNGAAAYAMIPIDNSIAGRVAGVHHLLSGNGVYIVGEHFQPIEHRLLGVPGTTLAGIQEVHSHVHALAQCGKYLRAHNLKAVVAQDTAGAAREIAEKKDVTVAAIASPLAGELYGLIELARDIEDAAHNVTRFIVISAKEEIPVYEKGMPYITSIFFKARSVPAALFKAIGGFATGGVNLLKLESYLGDGFRTAQFYIEAEAHPGQERMKLALAELAFYSEEVRILGAYAANPYRTS